MATTINGASPDLKDRALGTLFKQLSGEISKLVRKELELARAELTQKGKSAGFGAGMFGAAGILGFLALACLTVTFVAALAEAMPLWGAALIVAVVYGCIAGGLALAGKQKVTEAAPAVPDQTIASVKEDVQWAKAQLR